MIACRPRWIWLAWIALAVLLPASTQAAVRAWLEQERITFGQGVRLLVESEGGTPDFSPLAADFELYGQSSSTQASMGGGRTVVRTVHTVELVPREAGVIGIPPLQVGAERTAALTLTVLPAAAAAAGGAPDVFIEAELGSPAPYVQQSVPYTVRLYYAVQLVSGDVEVQPPQHASLEQSAEDRNVQVERDGRRYQVFERRFLLQPERSGMLELPAPRFRGRARRGGADPFFDNGSPVSVAGQVLQVEVRPQPQGAVQPWLPAQSLQLQRSVPSAPARSGEPWLVELSLVADGATLAQLPALELPPIAGAQVFPEAPQSQAGLTAEGRPQSVLKRRFAIVPSRSGALQLPAVQIGYWNTAADRADSASVPALDIVVEAGATLSSAAPATTPAAAASATAVQPAATSGAALQFWQALAVLNGLGLLVVSGWAWQQRRRLAVPRQAAAAPLRPAAVDGAALQQALQTADLGQIARALRGLHGDASLEALQQRLACPAQRSALQALARAQWRPAPDGQQHATLQELREAFRNGPEWLQSRTPPPVSALPPLYPPR